MDGLFSGDNMWTVLDVLIIVMLLGYGIKYYKDPPLMNSGKGFRMKFLMMNEESFRYGNRMGGILCIILGIIVAALSAVNYFIVKDSTFDLIIGGIDILLIVAMYFTLKLLVQKKFGKPQSKNPYDKKK